MHSASRGFEALVPWLIAALAVTALYVGKSVLIPITLAVLISFLLAPIVELLRRLGLPRPPAVIIAVLLALGGFGAISAVVVSQAGILGKDAPAYVQRVTAKVEVIKQEAAKRFDFLIQDSRIDEVRTRNARRRENALPQTTESGALPVEIQAAAPTAAEQFKTFVVPILAPLETTLIVLIVTIFILFQKEDLRDRMIRLMGAADLHRSTVALNNGAKRLSRYFLSQFAINGAFGMVVWGGLFLIGVPAASLWGILAGLLRFVPYVGSIIAAVGPLAIAAAVDPGWGMMVSVALLFVVLEPLAGYVIEPLLYGHSTGLSPVSVVVAALFWTWIWGPVGLVLSVPLTLLLVVLGQHIPAFGVFDILLGSRPALSPAESFYQRILAGRADDALDQAEAMLDTMSLEAYYDEVVLGALRLAAADVDRGAVPRSALHAVCDGTLEVVAVLADHPSAGDRVPSETDGGGLSVICMPGRGPLDAVVNTMAAQLLRRGGWAVTEHSRERLPGGGTALLEPGSTERLCILGLFDQRATARLGPFVGELQKSFPALKVVIGVQRGGDERPVAVAGAHESVASLASLRSAIDNRGA